MNVRPFCNLHSFILLITANELFQKITKLQSANNSIVFYPYTMSIKNIDFKFPNRKKSKKIDLSLLSTEYMLDSEYLILASRFYPNVLPTGKQITAGGG